MGLKRFRMAPGWEGEFIINLKTHLSVAHHLDLFTSSAWRILNLFKPIFGGQAVFARYR